MTPLHPEFERSPTLSPRVGSAGWSESRRSERVFTSDRTLGQNLNGSVEDRFRLEGNRGVLMGWWDGRDILAVGDRSG